MLSMLSSVMLVPLNVRVCILVVQACGSDRQYTVWHVQTQ